MSLPRYAELARRALSREQPETLSGPSATDRSSAIRAMEEAMRARRRRRLQLRAASAATVALAVAAVIVLFLQKHDAAAPPVQVANLANVAPTANGGAMSAVIARSSGEGATITGGSPVGRSDAALSPGARVAVHPHGHALLDFESGTRINLDETSELAVVSLGSSQIFSLEGGSLRADVARLKAGERFIVRTLDAEVEVHGTSFQLGTAAPVATCGAGTTTRLTVYEGVVTVRSRGVETRVSAGGVWPEGCPSAAAAVATSAALDTSPESSARVAPAAPVASGRAPSAASAPSPPPSAGAAATTVPLSDLTNQNDLFAAAVQERRAGRLEAAIERYDAFLARYPDAPLAESAASQGMKTLRDAHDARAAAAARAYLARYPDGYSRSDAEAILGGGR